MQESGYGQQKVGTIAQPKAPMIPMLISNIEEAVAQLQERINVLHSNLESISIPRPSEILESRKDPPSSPPIISRLSKILDEIRICRNRIDMMSEELEI